jgi:hypothetical protein
MLNNSVHPLFVGTFGIVGVNTSEAVLSDSTLSIVLQIIIALGTLLKLWNDYKREEAKRNEKNHED